MLSKVVWVIFSFWITYSMRCNLLILYAKTFYDNIAAISIVVYLSYISSAISSLGYGIIGDRWRIDYLLIIASILDVITYWMEATAPVFLVLAIGYSIGGQPFTAIACSFNLKLIPTYYAQQIRGKLLQVYAVSTILGPVFGGIIANFYGYRTVFYLSAIISVVSFVYTSISFYNVEEALLKEQLTMKQHYSNRCIIINNNITNTNNGKKGSNYNINVISALGVRTRSSNSISGGDSDRDKPVATGDAEMEEKFKWIISNDYRFPVCLEDKQAGSLLDIDKYKGLLLILFTLYSALLGAVDFTLIPFYITYMQDRFDHNINIIISTSQWKQ